MHSFTPALASAPAPRPWPIAILWNHDDRAATLGLAHLAAEPDLGGPVGANEPYSGKVLNYTMDRHAEAAHIPYLGFEIRQDLIADDAGADRWAAIVVRTIRAALVGL
jgi:predicted N-formylglutamate amidohydrolase